MTHRPSGASGTSTSERSTRKRPPSAHSNTARARTPSGGASDVSSRHSPKNSSSRAMRSPSSVMPCRPGGRGRLIGRTAGAEQPCCRVPPRACEWRGATASAQLREEQRDLAGGGLVGVRAVDDVVLHLEAEVAADGAGSGLHRVGGAGQGAERLDRPRALDDEREQGAAGDERDQRAEERLLAVLAVVLLGHLPGQRAQLGGDQAQALGLQARDHLADQATGDAVGLDEDEGAGGGGFRHERGAYAGPVPGSSSERAAGSPNGEPSSSLRTCSRYSQMSTKTPPTNHMTLLMRPVSSSGTCSAVAIRRPWGRRC